MFNGEKLIYCLIQLYLLSSSNLFQTRIFLDMICLKHVPNDFRSFLQSLLQSHALESFSPTHELIYNTKFVRSSNNIYFFSIATGVQKSHFRFVNPIEERHYKLSFFSHMLKIPFEARFKSYVWHLTLLCYPIPLTHKCQQTFKCDFNQIISPAITLQKVQII